MQYTQNQWFKLIKYLEHAHVRPDNTEIERIIKQFVIGRKNWLFSYSPLGAHSSASLYSFIQSARANGLDEFSYLQYLFKALPSTPNDQLSKLLPHRIDSDLLK